MGQDPYGSSGGFTPYQPDATPDSEPTPVGVEPTPVGAELPYVPYGGAAVPYRGSAAAFYAPTAISTVSAGRRVLPWVIGIGVLVVTCGGGVAGIIGAIAGAGDVHTSSGSADAPFSDQVYVNDLKVGQCLNGAGFATDEPVSALEIVPCSAGHDTEVLAVNTLDSKEAASYDFNDEDQLDATCRPSLVPGQKRLLNDPDYFLVAFTETETPVTGDKVACLLRRADGSPLIGTWDEQVQLPADEVEPS